MDDTIPNESTWSWTWWKFQGFLWRRRICNGIKVFCNITNEHKLTIYLGIQLVLALTRSGLFLWSFLTGFFGNGMGVSFP